MVLNAPLYMEKKNVQKAIKKVLMQKKLRNNDNQNQNETKHGSSPGGISVKEQNKTKKVALDMAVKFRA